MKRSLLVLGVLLTLTACGRAPAPNDTGITGQVLVGPTCPVVQDGQECPDKPYQASITVLDQNGFEVTTFQTGEDGRFTVNLSAGTYTIRPLSPPGMPLPAASEFTIIVVAGSFNDLLIRYDSGIR